ncbi:MAG: hypothetical protein JJT78_09225 [Leptospira sp.]|nr:hypothetical protein [Leptospira sp.]
MEIFVNDHKLDVNLDNEKTLAEVFQGVAHWVESNGKYVVSCFADGKDFGVQEMGSHSHDKINRMDFIIGEEIDVLISSLEELDRYVDSIGNTLIGRDSLTDSETRDLSEGMIWIDSIITSAKKLLRLKLDAIRPMGKGKTVEVILENLHKKVVHLDSVAAVEDYLEDLRDLKLFILDLRNRTAILDLDTDKLLDIIREYSTKMDAIKAEFVSINENFQSGKDSRASELLTDAIGKLNTLLTALISLRSAFPNIELDKVKVGDEKLSEFNKNLNTVLVEVANALENNDIVQAGDILEYEIPDYLDRFKPFLDEILQKVEVGAQ